MTVSLKKASLDILTQLIEFLQQVPLHLYTTPLPLLSDNTIGKHVRHIVEFYECIFSGASTGIINYDARSRDIHLETDPVCCIDKLHAIASLVQSVETDKKLHLQTHLSADGDLVCIETSFFRELVYTIEHAVHHMAIIKMALKSVEAPLELPLDFGIASSTLQHQQATQLGKLKNG